jgi:hypothetical protein
MVTQNTHSVLEVGTTVASRDYTSFISMYQFDAHPVWHIWVPQVRSLGGG